DGNHTFGVEAIDLAGNVSQIASVGWTVDATPPTSSVTALPQTKGTTSFTLNWSGSDGTGSGVASYSVYVSDNNQPFQPFVKNTTQTSATFTGVNGHAYGFYSV